MVCVCALVGMWLLGPAVTRQALLFAAYLRQKSHAELNLKDLPLQLS